METCTCIQESIENQAARNCPELPRTARELPDRARPAAVPPFFIALSGATYRCLLNAPQAICLAVVSRRRSWLVRTRRIEFGWSLRMPMQYLRFPSSVCASFCISKTLSMPSINCVLAEKSKNLTLSCLPACLPASVQPGWQDFFIFSLPAGRTVLREGIERILLIQKVAQSDKEKQRCWPFRHTAHAQHAQPCSALAMQLPNERSGWHTNRTSEG